MKKVLILLFFLVGSGLSAADTPTEAGRSRDTADRVKVRTIRIVGLEKVSEPTARGLFLELKEGDEVIQADLDQDLFFIEKRMRDSALFDSVQLTAAPSESQPGAVNIVAEVSESLGFQISGGNAYGEVTLVNFGGSGKDLTLDAGYNAQSLRITDRHTFFAPWFYSAAGGNFPQGYTKGDGTAVNLQNLGGKFSTGLTLGRGWEVSVFQETSAVFTSTYTYQDQEMDQGAVLVYSGAPHGYSPDKGVAAQARFTQIYPFGIWRGQARTTAYFALVPGLVKAALKASAATQVSDGSDRFALNLTGIDQVRKSFSASDLADRHLVGSAELRCQAAGVPVFGFSTLDIEPALFFDCGTNTNPAAPALTWAYGFALRLFFEVPINVPVRLELGRDQDGKMAFFFAVEAPF